MPGRRATRFPRSDVPPAPGLPAALARQAPLCLPEMAEVDVVRHFNGLARKSHGVDNGFYPLGSCTMKYNPKLGEKMAREPGFAGLHPLLPQLRSGGMLTQGALEVLAETERLLCEITGMAAFTLQPLAGAHGELAGMMIIAAWHRAQGRDRRVVLVPDSAHGTNPASAAIAGFRVVPVPSDDSGLMDFDAFRERLDDQVAAVMLTCPNTLGLFNPKIGRIAQLTHEAGGLMYYDGANFNAILGRVRPGDLGFDVVHLNLHKTFAAPHGGGGPGAGPVGVSAALKKHLPVSVVVKRADGTYALDYRRPESIGYIAPFYGNFLVILKAYAYMLTLGREGMLRVSENAVLNARYLAAKLADVFEIPHHPCMHEFVISARREAAAGVRAADIAKRILDFGYHSPTVYFPLTVPEALMVEPTETESRETLDRFAAVMAGIAREAREEPDLVRGAPHCLPVKRVDEVRAARQPQVRWVPPATTGAAEAP